MLKNKKFWSDIAVLFLVMVAIVFSLLFFKQRIETIKETQVFKNITDDWKRYDESGLISFKYPQDWEIEMADTFKNGSAMYYEIYKKDNKEKTLTGLTISELRSINIPEPVYAIQVSIPFGKQNYIILSTSTNNEEKNIFYNIASTIEFKK
uniref:Uncharacterized protein n=1 Tax=candidate division CPR3 bacterium TaxID=2268181 RepID=A0A7C4RAZ9_UNCC3